MFFIYFHPYFNSYISFRQEYFSFRPCFCLIADIQGIIYLPLPFHQSLFRKIKFITEQSTTSFPLYLIWFAAQSPCIRQSRTAVSVGSQRIRSAVSVSLMANALQTHGDCSSTPPRLRRELKNFWTDWKNFARWRLHCECAETHCECTANALRMRWDYAESLKTEKCSIRSGVAVKFAKVWERHMTIVSETGAIWKIMVSATMFRLCINEWNIRVETTSLISF